MSQLQKQKPDNRFTDGSSYHFQKVTTTWTNTAGYPAVVVGTDFAVSQVQGAALMQVLDPKGTAIDSVYVVFTTSGEAQEFMPRKMLVPNGYQFATSGNGNAMVIICASIEAALRIL